MASSMLLLSLRTLNQISADAPPRMAMRISAGSGRYFRYGRLEPPEILDRTGPLPFRPIALNPHTMSPFLGYALPAAIADADTTCLASDVDRFRDRGRLWR